MNNFVEEATKCGWCRKALTPKRRNKSPVGPECEGNLPEQVNIAFLNITQHDSLHGYPGTAFQIAEHTIENHFGDEINMIMVFDMSMFNEMSEATISTFWNDEGVLRRIHYINPDEGHESVDEGDDLFYNKRELILKRRLAMMLDKRTNTKMVVAHIDADWLWFLNGGCYHGPIHSRETPESYAKKNGWEYPIRCCEYCHLMMDEYEQRDRIMEICEEIEAKKEKLCCCGLGEAIYNELIILYGNAEEMLEHRVSSIENHDWFRNDDAGFLGRLERYTIQGHFHEYPNLVQHDGINQHFDDNQGFEIEFDSDLGQDIIVNNLLPIFLRGLAEGFNENWEWMPGFAATDSAHLEWPEWMTAVLENAYYQYD